MMEEDVYHNDDIPEPEEDTYTYEDDPKFLPCVRSLYKFIKRKRTPYYLRQLQVAFEKDYFHWITYNAIRYLVDFGILVQYLGRTKYGSTVFFVVPANTVTPQRQNMIQTHIKSKIKVIELFSNPDVSHAIGRHLHALVKAELRANDFTVVAENANQFGGKVWTQTGENLDIIATHKKGFSIGAEIKNTLDYIPKAEFISKLAMCKFLGLKPVFPVRWMPKSYVFEIYKAGGFGWLFQYQAYPLGFESLCTTIKRTFGFPVRVMTELPPRAQELFSNWVGTQK